MAIGLTPYLQFPGTAREALDFYHAVLGGELSAMTFAEGMGAEDETQDLIMHSSLYVDRGLHLMASDHAPGQQPGGSPTLALSSSDGDPDEDARLERWWTGLSEGAQIQEPLATAPWGDRFGMLTDRFGVTWMVNISAASGD